MLADFRPHTIAGLLSCLLLVTACEGTPTGPTVPLSQQFVLAPGEMATVQGTSLRVQFVRVSGDSRCPADAVCILGGDAIVHLRVVEATSTDHELHTGGPPQAVTLPTGYRVELTQLQPYPFSGRTIAPGEYRATFVVTR